MLYLFILLIVLILVILMPINTRLETKQKNENQIIAINVRTLYGLVNLKFEIPYMDFILKGFKPAIKYNTEIKKSKTEDTIKKKNKILSFFETNRIYKIYKQNTISIKRLLDYVIKKTKIKHFFLNFTLGTDDAYNTALIYGVLWTVLGGFMAFMVNNFNISIKDVKVIPAFDKKQFEYELSCIITIKAGHIIIIGIRSLPIFLRSKKAVELHG